MVVAFSSSSWMEMTAKRRESEMSGCRKVESSFLLGTIDPIWTTLSEGVYKQTWIDDTVV